jgi:hypothetical protein
MNIDAKILNKKWQTESNNILKKSFKMTNSASSPGCKDSSTTANH